MSYIGNTVLLFFTNNLKILDYMKFENNSYFMIQEYEHLNKTLEKELKLK